ncbi:MAG: hypothetical protein M1822_004787 [Bathelium mastoideum]|nr:MAG: hypothetical protein M1822_004787 [Bathelium mastoideum]
MQDETTIDEVKSVAESQADGTLLETTGRSETVEQLEQNYSENSRQPAYTRPLEPSNATKSPPPATSELFGTLTPLPFAPLEMTRLPVTISQEFLEAPQASASDLQKHWEETERAKREAWKQVAEAKENLQRAQARWVQSATETTRAWYRVEEMRVRVCELVEKAAAIDRQWSVAAASLIPALFGIKKPEQTPTKPGPDIQMRFGDQSDGKQESGSKGEDERYEQRVRDSTGIFMRGQEGGWDSEEGDDNDSDEGDDNDSEQGESSGSSDDEEKSKEKGKGGPEEGIESEGWKTTEEEDEPAREGGKMIEDEDEDEL